MLTVLTGHVLDKLAELPDNSVHCVVTSPPYWGLRDYKVEPIVWGGKAECEHEWGDAGARTAHPDRSTGDHDGNGSGIFVDRIARGSQPAKAERGGAVNFGGFCTKCGAWRGQLGLEPTPELFLDHCTTIFRQVRRVLHPSGTLWLNMGDSYAGSGNGSNDHRDPSTATSLSLNADKYEGQRPGSPIGYKPKDLIGMPFLLSEALRQDGWYRRSIIIWHKPNPMPESVTDRPTTSHEYIFLMSKSGKYFYDAEAIKEGVTGEAHSRGDGVNPKSTGVGWDRTSLADPRDNRKDRGRVKANESFSEAVTQTVSSRNKRSVWTVPTAPYTEAHFATYPPDLVKPCVLAGTSAKGCCPVCLSPFERLTESVKRPRGDSFGKKDVGGFDHGQEGTPYQETIETKTTGWQPTCKCGHNLSPIPCTVGDFFAGSGTTGEVALELGRSAVLIELNPKYVSLIHKRLDAITPGMVLA